jgi:hypothetical protein
VVLLVQIVRTRGKAGHGDTAQLEQGANRQPGNGDYLRVRGFRPSHPGRHGQRRAIGPPCDVVNVVVKVIHPSHWEGLCAQRMVAVVNRDFSGTLMGSMSFSCSRP